MFYSAESTAMEWSSKTGLVKYNYPAGERPDREQVLTVLCLHCPAHRCVGRAGGGRDHQQEGGSARQGGQRNLARLHRTGDCE